MKKLLIVTDSWPPNCGGAGWSTFNMVNGLAQTGYDIEVITMNKPDAECSLHNNFFIRNFNGFSQTVFKDIRIYVKANKDKYDAVISTYLHSTRAVAGLGIPHITMIHDYWPICYKGICRNNKTKDRYEQSTLQNIFKSLCTEYSIWIKLLSPFIARYMYSRTQKGLKAIKKSNVVVYNSEYSFKRLSPYLVLNDIRHEIVNPFIKYEQGEESTKFGDYLLFVGKFNEYKGKDEIIELAKISGYTIFVIGDCEEKQLPENVVYLGYKTNKETKNYMRNAFAVLVPSQGEETYGMTAQEALNCGTPVICTNRGGVKEIVEDGVTGYVIKPTADYMLMAVETLRNKYTEIKKNIQDRQKDYKEQYSNNINRMDNIIKELTNENSNTLL